MRLGEWGRGRLTPARGALGGCALALLAGCGPSGARSRPAARPPLTTVNLTHRPSDKGLFRVSEDTVLYSELAFSGAAAGAAPRRVAATLIDVRSSAVLAAGPEGPTEVRLTFVDRRHLVDGIERREPDPLLGRSFLLSGDASAWQASRAGTREPVSEADSARLRLEVPALSPPGPFVAVLPEGTVSVGAELPALPVALVHLLDRGSVVTEFVAGTARVAELRDAGPYGPVAIVAVHVAANQQTDGATVHLELDGRVHLRAAGCLPLHVELRGPLALTPSAEAEILAVPADPDGDPASGAAPASGPSPTPAPPLARGSGTLTLTYDASYEL